MLRTTYLRAWPLVALYLAMVGKPVSGELWSEKLGFPAGRRVIILNAREMGISWEMNEAGKQLLRSGDVSSVAVVATGPWFEEFASWSQAHSNRDIGVSVALTNPYSALHWSLLSPEQRPTTLVDADGHPWKSVVQLVVSATAEDVQHELDMQINRARNAGLKVSHISGYYGTVFSRPDFAAVFLGAARKYWLPAPVVELSPERIEQFRRQGFPIDDEMLQLISNYPLPKLDDFQIMPGGESFDQKRDNFCQLLKLLPPGLIQIVCRPATESQGLKLLADDWQQRVWDAKVLSDEKVKQIITQEQIIVTNWREIMQRFEAIPLADIEDEPSSASTE